MNLPACLCALVQTRALVYVSRHVFVGAGARRGMNVCERTCLYAHAHATCHAHTDKGINLDGSKQAFEDLTRFSTS